MALMRRIFDPFLLMLIATVAMAAILPARGTGQAVADEAVTVAVAGLFFLYGARLSPAAVWSGLAHWRLQSLVFASTFVLFPLVGVAIGATLGHRLPEDLTVGLLFLCLLPSTVQSSIAFTSIAGGNVPAALCSASVSNLLGVMATPLLVWLVFPAAGAGLSLHSLEEIGLQILLPFAAGQAARPLIGGWLLHHKGVTAVFDRGSILVVVYAAFSAGMTAGVWTQVSPADLLTVLVLDLLVLGLVIGITTLTARSLGMSKPDEIAVVFCGSKKSMASGVPMAAILFPGHVVSLVVLPLMVFHQAQLFVCASLARRYAGRAASPMAAETRQAPASATLSARSA